MPEISVSPETLREKAKEIAEYDEKLDAASGSEAAGKRALANSLASENEATWKGPADAIKIEMQKLSDDPAKLAGVYTGIRESIRKEFSTTVEAWLEEEAKARKTDQPTLSQEEVTKLSENRKTAVEQFKALKGILVMVFGPDEVKDIPDPKKRTGSRGPRGPRVFQFYDFYLDGQPRSKSQNSLSSIAATEMDWKVAEIRDYLKSKGLDLDNPVDDWEYELPNGKKLRGVKAGPAASDEDDNGEVDDDEVDDDEGTEEETLEDVE